MFDWYIECREADDRRTRRVMLEGAWKEGKEGGREGGRAGSVCTHRSRKADLSSTG
jgi:hypothetical protein